MGIQLNHKRIALETRRIRLREIRHKDLTTIFQWRNTEKFRFLLHHSSDIISFEAFCKEFALDAEGHKYQYLVEKTESGVPIGFTYVDTFSEQYKSCFINLFIDEPFEKKGYGTDVFILFVLFLFQRAGLKKLFVHAFDFNHNSISFARNIGMRELNGNVTRVPQRGNILCFAADESILPRLLCLKEYLSRPPHKIVAQSINQSFE